MQFESNEHVKVQSCCQCRWLEQDSDTTFPSKQTILNHKQHMHYTYCLVLRNYYRWRQLPLKRVCDVFNFQSAAGVHSVRGVLCFLASWHSLLVKLKALKIAQPDLESLVMEHHLKDCIDGSFAGAARLAENRWEAPPFARPGRSRRTSTSGALLQ